ncbi:MAG: glycosyl hydrolase [Candidatus Cryptobacteroides sp.]
MNKLNTLALAALALLAACTSAPTAPSPSTAAALEKGFAAPPDEAKPRVWWHWMNGNVTMEGAMADIEWMHRVGIGGFHVFDAGLTTPQIVDHRVSYMSDEWKRIFEACIRKADSYGMETAVAGSPGWSETGGPWVEPARAMKKLVWSETEAAGGLEYDAVLPHPPVVSGSFQDVPVQESTGGIPEYYEDVAVVAFRVPAPSPASLSPKITSSGGEFTLEQLSNGRMTDVSELPYGPDGAWIQYEFELPQTICGADIMQGIYDDFTARVLSQGDDLSVLEYSDDGLHFTPIATTIGKVFRIATLSFEPVTARYFRLRLADQQTALNSYFAPANRRGIGTPAANATGVKVAEFNLFSSPRVGRYIEKAGFFPAADLYDSPSAACQEAFCPAEVIDLSDKVDADGHLRWTPGEGHWKILRFGYSLTGHQNSPASPEATGLEVDKLDAEAVRDYIEHYIGMYSDAAGGMMGEKGIHYLMFDSWEAGCLNWTPKMFEAFRKECGYELVNWLPAIAGYVVGSPEASDRFLWDFRRTIAELTAVNHYDLLTEVLEEHGLERYTESHELVRAFIADGMRVKKNAAIPMCAMWTGDPSNILAIGASGADCRESASVAHLYGKKYVAAESLTQAGDAWGTYPEILKERADLLMANGLNRFIIHESAHQPLDDFKPGLTLDWFGQWFNRHDTWAEQAVAWMDYLSRSCFLLQQGRPVADILSYFGEDNNVTCLYRDALPAYPEGYNFDFVNADALMHDLKVRDGKIIAPSGASYSLISLGENARMMSLPVAKALMKLVGEGAVVAGQRPVASPSLSDDPSEFEAVVGKLWSGGPVTEYGKGRVYASADAAPALEAEGCIPDVTLSLPSADSKYLFLHRICDGVHIYWLDSRTRNVEDIEASFNVCGLEPEVWNAVDGSIKPASYRTEGGRTVVKLHFEAEDALFVVFRKKAATDSLELPEPSVSTSPVDGGWEVSFNCGMGAPGKIVFDELKDWSRDDNLYIRYYSGTATYSKTVNVDASAIGESTWLCLGNVCNIAGVRLNGEDLGIVWKRPWKVDISSAVREGENELEITVANLWVNRMIGDQRGDAGQFAKTVMTFRSAGEPLRPSGLLGPVSIETVRY